MAERFEPNRRLKRLAPSDRCDPLRDRPLNADGDTGRDDGDNGSVRDRLDSRDEGRRIALG